MTVDEAFVLPSPHFDRHTTYVAMSRHKDQVKLYTNKQDFPSPQRLKTKLGRQGEKLSTLDFTHPVKEKVPSFIQNVSQGMKNLWSRLKGDKSKAEQKQKVQEQPQERKEQITVPGIIKQNQEIKMSQPKQQQDLKALRDQFINENKTTKQPQRERNRDKPSRGWDLSR